MSIKTTCFAAAICALSAAAPAIAAPLSITLEGVEAREAPLYISVQTRAQFLQDDGIAGQIIEAPEAGTVSIKVDVPEGAYSVSVWHDLNRNEVFDMGANGMPDEGWAMINGAEMKGPPNFDAQSTAVSSEGGAVSVDMMYPK